MIPQLRFQGLFEVQTRYKLDLADPRKEGPNKLDALTPDLQPLLQQVRDRQPSPPRYLYYQPYWRHDTPSAGREPYSVWMKVVTDEDALNVVERAGIHEQDEYTIRAALADPTNLRRFKVELNKYFDTQKDSVQHLDLSGTHS